MATLDQVQCQDVNNFPSNSLLDSSSSPFSPIPASESVTVDSPSKTPSKMESDAILAEISDLAGSQLGRDAQDLGVLILPKVDSFFHVR